MQIINEHNKIHTIASLDDPFDFDYFWTLNLQDLDWQLSKLVMLEEFSAPTLTIVLLGRRIELPADWHILVYSPETSDVDMIPVSDLTKGGVTVFLYDSLHNKVLNVGSRVIDYSPNALVRVPTTAKNVMICQPVDATRWIMVAPTDTHSKYFKRPITVGEFFY